MVEIALRNQIDPYILYNEQFTRANKYDPMWILKNGKTLKRMDLNT